MAQCFLGKFYYSGYFNELIQQIEQSSASSAEKTEAKSRLAAFLEHPLVGSVLSVALNLAHFSNWVWAKPMEAKRNGCLAFLLLTGCYPSCRGVVRRTGVSCTKRTHSKKVVPGTGIEPAWIFQSVGFSSHCIFQCHLPFWTMFVRWTMPSPLPF